MKKVSLAIVLVVLLICSFVSHVGAYIPEMLEPENVEHTQTTAEFLQMTLTENITVLENGTAQVAILIDVPSSPLAEMYRRLLAAPPDADVEEEMAIPESTIEEIHSGEDATGILKSVRGEFLKSIAEQQQFSLGFITDIFDSKMVPRSSNNGCRVSISALSSLPIMGITQIGSHFKWKIGIGPKDNYAIGAAAGYGFTSIELIQLMLESLPEEQLYKSFWSIRIELPATSQLLNGLEISGLSWKINFGGGTYLNAWASLDGSSTIVLNEETIVTEQEIDVAPSNLCDAFSSYKTFSIEYLSPQSSPTFYGNEEYTEQAGATIETSGDSWSYTWTTTWSDSASKSFTYGPLNALLTVSASITLSGYVGWDFDLFEGLTSFESWMQLDTSVDLDFEATATASYSKTWEQPFFSWKTTFSFFVGPLPVWADFEITATGVLTVNAYGELVVTAEASASASFKAGVEWTSDYGWTGIFEIVTSASHTGPTIDAEAGVWIRPSVEFRLAFLFYGVAGPFVEFEPYATATVTCSYPPPHGTWLITASLKITAGATFAGWLKSLLGLDDWAITLYDTELARWSGSWGSSSISITETLNPSTSPPSGPVRVYGTATFNDGSPVSYTDVIITVAGSSWTTTTDGTGGYSQFISAPESVGTYTVQVYIATGSLTGSNSKTLTVVEESPVGSRYTLTRTTTCKDVQSSDPYDPIDETTVFRRSDQKAVTWVHLTDVYKSGGTSPLIKIKWEFYGPTGSLYSQTEGTVPDPGEGAYWLWYKTWAWIWIDGYSAADMEGRWHSKVYIDEGSGYEFKKLEEFIIGYEVTDRTMAKDVQTSTPYEPIDRTDSFLNTDPKAWGWIRLDEVAESLEIKWEWFEPSGAKYGEFFWTTENPSTYWDWYKAWCWIDINGYQPQYKLGMWEVRAYIQDVYGSWDLEYSQYFTISDNTPPGIPGTPIDDGVYSTTGTATWTWTAATEDGTVSKYQIQVGTTPSGNDVFDGYVDDLSKTLNNLPSGFTYYARVRAMNTVGQWGPWSGASDGITVDKPPITLIIQGPSGTIDYNDVFFGWAGSDDITPVPSLVYSYYLEGYDIDWSPWMSSTSKQYNDLLENDYVFKVKAKDQLGNVDPTPANRSFTVTPTYNVHLESIEDNSASFNLGTITFGGTPYSLPNDTTKPATTYLIEYIPAPGYEFDHWETTPAITVDDPNSQSTTATVTGDGTLKAIYQVTYDVRLESVEDNVASSNLGTITFGGTPYSLPNDTTKPATTYLIEYIPAPGYEFDHWETTPAITVDDPNSQSTTATVSGTGILKAAYKATHAAQAMWLEPPSIGNLQKGDTFTVDVYLNVTAALMNPGATGLYAWEFKLYYEKDKLNCTGFTDHFPFTNWNPPNNFAGGLGITPDYNFTHGRVWRAISAVPVVSPYPTPFVGVMSICTMSFEVIDQPEETEPPYTGLLSLGKTIMCDDTGAAFSHTAQSSTYTIQPIGTIHDIAITDILPSRKLAWDGLTIRINITISNQGDFVETSNVSIYANKTIIETETIALTNGTSTIVTIVWNIAGIAHGNYTISANATIVAGEMDTADNNYVDGIITIAIPGDVNGDRIVDIVDLVYVAIHFGAEEGEPDYDLYADLNDDGIIDIVDAVLVAIHFGETW